MNYENFKVLLAKSKLRVAIIGAVIALASVGMVTSLLIIHETKVAYWIVTGIFVALGFPMLILSVKDLLQIRAGTWPILKAISEHQEDYVVWVYNNEVVSKVSGVDVGKSSNIMLYNKDGKLTQIILGKKASLSANTVIHYLASEFPAAHVGYTDEARGVMSKRFNKKM